MPYDNGLTQLNLDTLYDRGESVTKSFYRSILKNDSKLHDLIPSSLVHHYSFQFRNPRTIPIPKCKTGLKIVFYHPVFRNGIP